MSLINPLDQSGAEELRNPANEGVTDYFAASGNGREWTYNGSKGRIQARGGFGGGTLTLETSQDGGTTWVVDGTFSLTAAGVENINSDVPRGSKWRFVLTGATTPTLSIFVLQGKGF